MSLIDDIRTKCISREFDFSQHAVDQSILRRISVNECCEAVANGTIIEDYPNDKYGPSCLIFGRTATGRPLHVQCSYPYRPRLIIITLYEPDPARWIDYTQRRQ